MLIGLWTEGGVLRTKPGARSDIKDRLCFGLQQKGKEESVSNRLDHHRMSQVKPGRSGPSQTNEMS